MISNVDLISADNLVEYVKSVPFDVSHSSLYNAAELYEGYDPDKPETFCDCFDSIIYRHYLATGKQTSDIRESMARMRLARMSNLYTVVVKMLLSGQNC